MIRGGVDMLSEKQKNKIYNRNFQTFHSGKKLRTKHKMFRDEILEYLKINKDKIIESTPLPSTDIGKDEEQSQFEIDLYNQMRKYIDDYVESTLQPEYEKEVREYLKAKERLLNGLDNLMEKIKNNEFSWYDGENVEWGGAGVIITSDCQRPARENDIFICVNYPNLIVGVFDQVKELGAGYIDFENKYVIYGFLAKSAQRQINKYENTLQEYNTIIFNMVKEMKEFIEEG